MSNHDTDSTGHLVQNEVQVAATPEQVWEAIATSTGNAAWLFPADIEPHEGGKMVIHRQPYGGDAVATVTAWDPPRRFAFEEVWEGPDGSAAPPVATEFLVEARAGGTCVVRVVSGMHRDAQGWEEMLDGAGEGWQGALALLAGYLAHFAPQAHTAFLNATVRIERPLDDRPAVSAALMDLFGLAGRQAGDAFRAPDGAPPLEGTIEGAEADGVIVRADEPCPALVEISNFPMDGESLTISVSAHLYGDRGPEFMARDESRWQAWLDERLPTLSAAR